MNSVNAYPDTALAAALPWSPETSSPNTATGNLTGAFPGGRLLPLPAPPTIGDDVPGSPSTQTSDPGAMLESLLSTISTLISSLVSYLFGGGSANGAAPSAAQPQTTFANASASSTGDPHDAFAGQSANGTRSNATWDDMRGHGDLLDSDSMAGGYRISTRTTAPDANGVTYNEDASVRTHDGTTAVRLAADGTCTIDDAGRATVLAPNASVALGADETVTRNAGDSVTIVDRDAAGGSITTTLSTNGHGVDVRASAQDVDLGGYLVRGAGTTTAPSATATPATASDALFPVLGDDEASALTLM